MFVIRIDRRRLALLAAALCLLIALARCAARVIPAMIVTEADVIIRHVPVSEKAIALTFDDGPDGDFTPRILEVLRAHGAKATFFVVGKQVEYYPEILRQIAADGHEIGSHTYSHPKLSGLSEARLRSELARTADLIRVACGVAPACFRPPFGVIGAGAIQVVRDSGYAIVLWDRELDSRDWERPGVDRIVERVVSNARPGGIVLMHDGGGCRSQTVAALGKILDQLAAQGYRFVTVSELLRLSEQNGIPGR